MALNIKEMTDEELQKEIDKLRTTAPERIIKAKRASAKKKGKTASVDAVQEALAKLLAGEHE